MISYLLGTLLKLHWTRMRLKPGPSNNTGQTGQTNRQNLVIFQRVPRSSPSRVATSAAVSSFGCTSVRAIDENGANGVGEWRQSQRSRGTCEIERRIPSYHPLTFGSVRARVLSAFCEKSFYGGRVHKCDRGGPRRCRIRTERAYTVVVIIAAAATRNSNRSRFLRNATVFPRRSSAGRSPDANARSSSRCRPRARIAHVFPLPPESAAMLTLQHQT
ncbi:hypothetical protein G5I_10991 [Acromyrmex echinatior]|uniref:Uncharacterized protein n=1 Tax=Acromyrmex echinatior TaxID=103372 RepID=F4WYE1_ACREC|nr:hypothetical protein G5I_10991 [Acromyrmex echinatior]